MLKTIPSDYQNDSVEDSDSIANIKNPIMHMITSAQNYLQRSVAIMIKSVMSRLYGTKTVLSKFQTMYSQIKQLPESSPLRSEIKDRLDESFKAHCKFQKIDCIDPNKDWVWHSREMLPRKGDPQEEWKDLSEDLKSWKLDVCFKLIKAAKHDGKRLFGSEHMCRISDTSVNLKLITGETADTKDSNFKQMVGEAANTRNFYAHAPPASKMVEEYKQQFKVLEDLAQLVLEWVTHENQNKKSIECCEKNLHEIQACRKNCLAELMAQWGSVLEGLDYLNFNKYGYILICTPCNKSANVDISSEDLAKLSIIPWIAVVDFDTNSRKGGVFDSLCKLENNQYLLKESMLFPGIRVVDVFTMKDMRFAGQEKVCHVPWLFPHGEEHNQTDQACPPCDHDNYRKLVRKPLNDTMKEIATLSSEKQQKVITVVFCYGEYACKTEDNIFLRNLNHLCFNLQDDGGQVIILTDSFYVQKEFEHLHVFVFPLDKFCKYVYSCLSIGEDGLPPVTVPARHGSLPVKFVEDDFELVHEHVFEHEMHEYQARKKIELLSSRQQKDQVLIRKEIYKEVQNNFYKGQSVTWISLNQNHAIVRSEEHEVTSILRKMLDEHVSKKTEPSRFVLYHAAGAGASTLARQVLWTLKKDFPCVILKSNYQFSEKKIKYTVNSLKDLFDEVDKPILMLVDEEPFVNTVAMLTHQVQTDGIPMVFLHVQRLDNTDLSKPCLTKKGPRKSLVLNQGLNSNDIERLTDLLIWLFNEDEFSARKNILERMESMMVDVPKQHDDVTDFKCNGKILAVEFVENKMLSYYDLQVQWSSGTKEQCYLSHVSGYIRNNFKRVYLKAEISKLVSSHLYKTFQFYGLIYLGAEYQESMHEHIVTCLQSIPLNDLHILANLSVLFAFKVCESINVKAFENLCCAINSKPKPYEFNIKDIISEDAMQFLIVTDKGRFRITHPFVAEEIMKYYFSKNSNNLDFIAKFFCNFLNHILPKANHVNEASQAVNRLLYYREYTANDDDGHQGETSVKRQQFSSLISSLEKDCVKIILEYAASRIGNCHSFGHYARYLSKVCREYDDALKFLKEAEKRSVELSDKAMVYNIEGDIFRDKLEDCVAQPFTLDWRSQGNKAFQFHQCACNSYHNSHSCNPKVDHPLFGELTVRLLLLEKMKKEIPTTNFFEHIYSCPDLEVANTIGACHQLLAKLDEFIKIGEGGKNADTYEISIKKHKQRLYGIIESKAAYKKALLGFLEGCSDKRRPYFIRSYVNFCIVNSEPDTDWDVLKQRTEENLTCLNYDDRDMKNWLLIIRNISKVASDMKLIEEQLVLWQRSTSLSRGKFHNDLWASFYLLIYNFLLLVETDVVDYSTVAQVETFSRKTKDQSDDDKSRARIKEWLHKDGKGFGRLTSGKQKFEDMLSLSGSIVYATKEEARFYKSFPHISWKGLRIFFDPRNCRDKFEKNDEVTFTVGFSFFGPRALFCVPKKSSQPFSASPVKHKQKRQS